MTRLGIVFGGRSGEHSVSLMSATSVIGALDASKYEVVCIGITRQGEWKLYSGPAACIESGEWERTAKPFNAGDLKKEIDFAFPVLHGPYGEDGTIQGLFEMLDVPYAGCGVLASALAMDKIVAKELFKADGLPVCRHMAVAAEELAGAERLADRIEDRIEDCFSGKYPLFVKPSNMGSSVGISKVKHRGGLAAALDEAARHDRRIIVEEGIAGRELETAILGNASPEAAVVGEVLPSAEFYDYAAKYLDGGKSKICVPADIPQETAEEVRATAVKAYKALDCSGFARVDFFLEEGTGKVFLSEVNTIPGFTKYSMFPLLWQGAGLAYPRQLERIVEFGNERYYAKNHR
ncbi:MAG: D-alanine--D-alanine ligase [Clostridiales bacterium]|nr:D-alanine--D-alanine ligase [Clostridiales bacterium]